MTDFYTKKEPQPLTESFREKARHYIPLEQAEEKEMLKVLGLKELSDLFTHIPEEIRFPVQPPLPKEMDEPAVRQYLTSLADRNSNEIGYCGDGLADWSQPEIVSRIAALRRLATSYTPYQPERSQGTLIAHWIYQCLLSALTGYEAVNSSLYDRSTALVEAAFCSFRLQKKCDTILVSESLEPSDLAVLETHLADSPYKMRTVSLEPASGRVDVDQLRSILAELEGSIASFAFPQINTFGILEEVDTLTDICAKSGIRSIAVIDPYLIAPGGLKPPSRFGGDGADIVIGEGQHLALNPNFGGPGLGLFAIRYNDTHRNEIRNAPGRFVGKANDFDGTEGRVMVLSTREQHIRKEKATSNICSNQAFLATLVGPAILVRGANGFRTALDKARKHLDSLLPGLLAMPGVKLAFPSSPTFTEVTLETDFPVADLLSKGWANGFLAGTDVSSRLPDGRHRIKLTMTDRCDEPAQRKLVELFRSMSSSSGSQKGSDSQSGDRIVPEASDLRTDQDPTLPEYSPEEVYRYYTRLDGLNASPEESCYPLGSCTMKYNPYLNEWAAGLKGFTHAHPAAPASLQQGSLEVLYETQNWFKTMTGLAGVTTQPVAGAQGELVGLKMFQAYHRANGDTSRNVMLIPKSAHGTNFASAAMAGFPSNGGIALLRADSTGCVDIRDLDEKLEEYGHRVAGIMITNPNTGGIFETRFADIARKVHEVGGLVYLDGANLNAIAGWIDLAAMGVDAVHSNLHKTWTIPHGGGGPGDGIVAVSHKLVDFLPGKQIVLEDGLYRAISPKHSIGTFHRHWGNFAHKVRCYTYLLRLGREGVPRMSATAVLAARYLQKKLESHFPILPSGTGEVPRMHEFIISLTDAQFTSLESVGVTRAKAIPLVGKLFLDFGYHSPTVAFPEPLGLMFEPTESYTKGELDRLVDVAIKIGQLIQEHPEVVRDGPHFTPVRRFDEVAANRSPVLFETLDKLPVIPSGGVSPSALIALPVEEIAQSLVDKVASSSASQAIF